MSMDNVVYFQPPSGTKHARLRFTWYEQITADGLYDLVGVSHAIAQRDFCITSDQLATTLKVSVATAERLVKKLTERGHLKKVSGKAGRVPNRYEPILFNPIKNEGVGLPNPINSEGVVKPEMGGQPRQNRRVNPLQI